jgi:hypothetical protein
MTMNVSGQQASGVNHLRKMCFIVILPALLLLFVGCGSSPTASIDPNASKKACLAAQREFLMATDVFAAETGDYPTSNSIAEGYRGLLGASDAPWPAGFFSGSLDANNAPVCPGNGTIKVTYYDTATRPSIECSLHGSTGS